MALASHLTCAVTLSANRELSEAILRHLCQNPDAKDSLEGIARFWVRRQNTASLLHEVSRALDDLVDRGYLVVWLTGGGGGELGERIFSLDKRRLQEIKEMLKDTPSRDMVEG